jgi:PIN domain nuclease of toxin-antitoxin system
LRDPSVILDASALLAVAQSEPGAEVVTPRLKSAAISTVNWTEVIENSIERGIDPDDVRRETAEAGIMIVPFDPAQAEDAAELRLPTRRLGLSLADRACLALAKSVGAPALTTDRAWSDVDVGVDVELIR